MAGQPTAPPPPPQGCHKFKKGRPVTWYLIRVRCKYETRSDNHTLKPYRGRERERERAEINLWNEHAIGILAMRTNKKIKKSKQRFQVHYRTRQYLKLSMCIITRIQYLIHNTAITNMAKPHPFSRCRDLCRISQAVLELWIWSLCPLSWQESTFWADLSWFYLTLSRLLVQGTQWRPCTIASPEL